jgi:hypothetical protein
MSSVTVQTLQKITTALDTRENYSFQMIIMILDNNEATMSLYQTTMLLAVTHEKNTGGKSRREWMRNDDRNTPSCTS